LRIKQLWLLISKIILLSMVLFIIISFCDAQHPDGAASSAASGASASSHSSGKNVKICPEISVSPRNLSFSTSFRNWEQINIGIFNPDKCHINFLKIKLIVPDGWDLDPNLDENPPLYYNCDETTFLAEGYGDFHEDYIKEWFKVKPAPSTSPEEYILGAEYNVSYSYRLPNVVDPIVGNRLIGFKNVTLILEDPSPQPNVVEESLTTKSPVANVTGNETGMLQGLKEYQWLILLIFGAIAVVYYLVSLLFHPDVKRYSQLIWLNIREQTAMIPFIRKRRVMSRDWLERTILETLYRPLDFQPINHGYINVQELWDTIYVNYEGVPFDSNSAENILNNLIQQHYVEISVNPRYSENPDSNAHIFLGPDFDDDGSMVDGVDILCTIGDGNTHFGYNEVGIRLSNEGRRYFETLQNISRSD